MAGPSMLASDATRWQEAMPRPRAFVLSGGASLGAVQVGMLRALGEVGLEPDLLVGTSVGALNAAVVADAPSSSFAADRLAVIWSHLRRQDVFPGALLAQLMHVARTGYFYPSDGIERLIRRSLQPRRFEQLRRPLTVIASEVLTGHVRRISTGNLVPALLASTALPGLFAPVIIDGCPLWDGGSVANVPLRTAIDAGAASILVLDSGDVCHRQKLPRGVPDGMVLAMTTAMRQRVMIEAPLVANEVPLAYLPRPCATDRSLLDLASSASLIDPTYELTARFLAESELPKPGTMAGHPHHHS